MRKSLLSLVVVFLSGCTTLGETEQKASLITSVPTGDEEGIVAQLKSINSDKGAVFEDDQVFGIASSISKIVENPAAITGLGEQKFSFFVYEYELKTLSLDVVLTGNHKPLSLAQQSFLNAHEVEASRLIEVDIEGKSSWHAIQGGEVDKESGTSLQVCIEGVAKPLDELGFLVLNTFCDVE